MSLVIAFIFKHSHYWLHVHILVVILQMDTFLCGANNQKWDIKGNDNCVCDLFSLCLELMEYCRPDHGYTHDRLVHTVTV